jgi:protein-glucosylgalactosylhydroxylysine glucosidase
LKKSLLLLLLASSITSSTLAKETKTNIDRKALVARHNPVINKIDNMEPLTVGNGDFAFTADATGLQTLHEYYSTGIPLGTLSNWGWHSELNNSNYSLEQSLKNYNTYGREVSYASDMNSEAAKYLRANPHRMDLGKVGFLFNGEEIKTGDIKNVKQELNLWEGIIKSSFNLHEDLIKVETCANPNASGIAVKVKSSKENNLAIAFDFSYASAQWGKDPCDWNNPGKHSSVLLDKSNNSFLIKRVVDSTVYYVKVSWTGKAIFNLAGQHRFFLTFPTQKEIEFTWHAYAAMPKNSASSVKEIFAQSVKYWQKFWISGGAVDLSGSTDPRAKELERRIVLSQYLTAVNCSGSVPPQETGLVCNSWFGKPHLEMHWWHSAHFALWQRPELLEKSLSWYKKIFPVAKNLAVRQGYEGVRWPKMVGPDGAETPSNVAVFLIWQQPHPIFYAELLYRAKKDRALLERYKEIVFESANFMASYAKWDEKNKCYVLGPPLIPAQEIYHASETKNPPYELSYWKFGLSVAQKWRVRLGMQRDKKWDDVIKNLSKLPVRNGIYLNTETATNTFEDKFNINDHPSVVGTFGMLPNDEVDKEIMRSTLKQVMQNWNWKTTWGWDYPLLAMTAARIGEPEIAIDALLLDVQKNTYLINGQNFQEDRLPVYLPGNGGLLAAIAMMAAGWDGAPKINAPGFPQNGKWVVKCENINPAP